MRDAHYQVLEGEISRLSTEDTHVHYLSGIEQQQEMAGATAVLQAALGQAGAVHSAQAATYEGDPVEGFTMQVAGKTVSGSFWKATFKDGDHVQVIGQEHNGIFHAVAVAKPNERLLWIQPHCERGTDAQKRNLLKLSSWFVLFMLLCAVLLIVLMGMSTGGALVSVLFGTIIVLTVTVGMSWGDFMNFAGEMNRVGAALGLPRPENIDLFVSTKEARKSGKPELPLGVYYY